MLENKDTSSIKKNHKCEYFTNSSGQSGKYIQTQIKVWREYVFVGVMEMIIKLEFNGADFKFKFTNARCKLKYDMYIKHVIRFSIGVRVCAYQFVQLIQCMLCVDSMCCVQFDNWINQIKITMEKNRSVWNNCAREFRLGYIYNSEWYGDYFSFLYSFIGLLVAL